MEADYGFTQVRTKVKCKSPVFADRKLHHIAILKDFHIGSEGDIDPHGIPGFVSKFVCTGCGGRFKIMGSDGYFHPDYITQNRPNQ